MEIPDLIQKVTAQAERLAEHSWEYGTLTEALLELLYPDLSVFGRDAFPGGEIPAVDPSTNRALDFVRKHISLEGNILVDGEGAAGDSASLGVAAVLLSKHDSRYLEAAGRQFQTLVQNTPRLSNGAISHREKTAEAWADNVYMVAPFLAYYGAAIKDPAIVKLAVQQCQLYRDVLSDASSFGLWRHIIGPVPIESQDPSIWSTGNGWAVAGMARVLAVVKKSWVGTAAEVEELEGQLFKLIKEIFDGIVQCPRDDDSQLLRNHITDKSWFAEVAGTACLASAIYRVALLCPGAVDDRHIEWAERSRNAVIRHINPETGIVSPVVNPMDWRDRKPVEASPEGQCFALLMYAAHRDWLTASAQSQA